MACAYSKLCGTCADFFALHRFDNNMKSFFSAVVLALALATTSAFVPRANFLARAGVASMAAPATAADLKLPASVKPGVVTGPALNDLLNYAKEKGFAMPGVNIVGALRVLFQRRICAHFSCFVYFKELAYSGCVCVFWFC